MTVRTSGAARPVTATPGSEVRRRTGSSGYLRRRRHWIRFSIVLVALALSARARAAPPNNRMILCDDHGYQAIGAEGRGLNQTPNIDRVAKEGCGSTDCK